MASENKKAVSLPYTMDEIGAPDSLRAHLLRYLEWLAVHHYSDKTVTNARENLGYFIRWAEERELWKPQDFTLPIIERYQRHLYYLRKANGKQLTSCTQGRRLSVVRGYFRWLVKQRYLLYNPAAEIELPKATHRLPKTILSVREVESIMALPNLNDVLGVRDRAILEVLYSTGIRRMEVINLTVHDIDHERGSLAVRLGKGRKDRVVPIGQRALQWVEKYQNDVRPELVVDPNNDALFVNQVGVPLRPQYLSHRVRDYVLQAGLGKLGSCHLFRHSMATLMLENGADVRYIQALLGHSSLSTTQIYTHVAIRQLKAIHEATHPASQTRTEMVSSETMARPDEDVAQLLEELCAEQDDERE